MKASHVMPSLLITEYAKLPRCEHRRAPKPRKSNPVSLGRSRLRMVGPWNRGVRNKGGAISDYRECQNEAAETITTSKPTQKQLTIIQYLNPTLLVPVTLCLQITTRITPYHIKISMQLVKLLNFIEKNPDNQSNHQRHPFSFFSQIKQAEQAACKYSQRMKDE